MSGASGNRLKGVTALAVFFGVGAAIAGTSCLSLLFPGSLLEPMWRVNPRARESFGRLGVLSVALLGSVAAGCALSATGLWRGRRWGYGLALILLTVNLVGDIANVVLGVEPRAALGVPIVAIILAYLSRPRVRAFFGAGGAGEKLGG